MTQRYVTEVLIENVSYDSLQTILDQLKEKGISEDQFSQVTIDHEREYPDSYDRVVVSISRPETEAEAKDRRAAEKKLRAANEERQRQQYEALKKQFGDA